LAKAAPGEYPLVTTGAERRACESFQFDTRAVCIPLVSSTGHGHASLKNVHYQEGKFALGTILVALTAIDDNELDIQFLHLYLSQLKDIILVPLMSGAANVALSATKIKYIEIPLPPIEKQKEIVVQFKSIVIEETEIKNELTHQQTLLKKLRQQILQEAIEGKLTEEFRIKNYELRKQYEQELAQADDPESIRNLKLKIRNCRESAASLLSRIKAEKEQLIKDKKIKNQKSLPPIIDEKKPFNLPDGWEWCLLDKIVHFTNGKAHEQFIDSSGKYILVNSKYISMNGKVVKRTAQCMCSVYKNDILIVMSDVPNGKALARCFLVDKNDSYSLNQRIGSLSPLGTLLPIFLALQLNRNQHFLNFNDGKKQTNLRKDQILSCPLVIPPLPEQKAIVAKAEKLFAICDQLEVQITNNQTHSEQLMQAVLKEAFQQSDTEPQGKEYAS